MRGQLISAVLFLSVLLSAPSIYCAQAFDYSAIEAAKAKYLAANQYNEFIGFLDNFKDKDKAGQLSLNYYKAQARYLQLKYLEEKQSWDDYFANGNTYRQQLEESARKVVDQADAGNPLKVKAGLLLWQFHHGQQDAFVQSSLDELVAGVNLYAKGKNDPELIRAVADSLLYGEENAAAHQIYKLYVNQLTAGKMTDTQLKALGSGFYKEGNLELAQAVFNIYIERASKTLQQGKFIKELFEIASFFVYKPQGLYDMAYAEEIYAKIEGLGGQGAFDQATTYLRSFNLEKFRDYKAAQKLYLQLIQLYPDSKYFDEAVYKIAMINAYVFSNISQARQYFNLLAAKKEFSPHVIASLYQLGLLAQWEGDSVKAKEYYELLLRDTADKYPSIASQANERLKEIQENKQISYNLKTFLDLSLKSENTLTEMGKAELKSSAYALEKGQKATISTFVNMPQSGCNQVELQYLWSGDLAGASPAVTDASFQCTYADSGTKAINIVVISPAGSIDRYFTMVDVY